MVAVLVAALAGSPACARTQPGRCGPDRRGGASALQLSDAECRNLHGVLFCFAGEPRGNRPLQPFPSAGEESGIRAASSRASGEFRRNATPRRARRTDPANRRSGISVQPHQAERGTMPRLLDGRWRRPVAVQVARPNFGASGFGHPRKERRHRESWCKFLRRAIPPRCGASAPWWPAWDRSRR